jgi:hypothetical protein
MVSHGTGTLKSSTFRTNEARGAGGGWGQGIVRPCSAQCVLKPRRRFGDEMLPSEGSEACRGLPTVAGGDRVESPHMARAHPRFWLASRPIGLLLPYRTPKKNFSHSSLDHRGRETRAAGAYGRGPETDPPQWGQDGCREAVTPHTEGLAAAGGLPWKRDPTTIQPGTGCACCPAFLLKPLCA